MLNRSAKLKTGFSELPETISNLLEKTIPEAPTIDTPTDVDSAIVAQGVLSKYLLDLFYEMRGFSIAAAMMHIGQLNTVNQTIALASLRVRKGLIEIEIILPDAGTNYALESAFIAEISISGDVTGVSDITLHRKNPDETTVSSAMLTGAEAVEFELLDEESIQPGHYYAEQILYDTGSYEYYFTAMVGEETEITTDTITIEAN
jgi:hypothetical protein